ncbi:putative Uncharacterized 50.6 kDa protein in the 5'region of gyrA and gyrB [Pseudomonas sp. OF001]|nr:putative Uncharacterized 50.6 kDa protein in the 5'region of gyrA and gyrB [Pseudomonas sp. OF001]
MRWWPTRVVARFCPALTFPDRPANHVRNKQRGVQDEFQRNRRTRGGSPQRPRAPALPRAQSPIRGARRACAALAVRRRADALDERLVDAGAAVRRARPRRALLRRRRPRVRRLLPGRHRQHVRPLAGAGRRGAGRAGRQRPDHHAARRGCGALWRAARRALRPALLAGGDHRHRRQPLRAALGAGDHRAQGDPGVRRLLPRHRRRGHGARQGRPHRAPSGTDRSGAQPDPAQPRGAVQRSRRAGSGAGPRRRRRGALRAGTDQHRHGAAAAGLHGAPARADPPGRHPADRRRDPHHLHRSRRLHPRLEPRAGLPHPRQAGGRRGALLGVRLQRGDGPGDAAGPPARQRAEPRPRPQRHGHHPVGQRPGHALHARQPGAGDDPGGLRAHALAGGAPGRGLPWADRTAPAALVGDRAGRALRVPVLRRAAADRRRGRGGVPRQPADGPAPVPDQPRHPDHAVPQHDPVLPGDHRRRRRPAARHPRRGAERAAGHPWRAGVLSRGPVSFRHRARARLTSGAAHGRP